MGCAHSTDAAKVALPLAILSVPSNRGVTNAGAIVPSRGDQPPGCTTDSPADSDAVSSQPLALTTSQLSPPIATVPATLTLTCSDVVCAHRLALQPMRDSAPVTISTSSAAAERTSRVRPALSNCTWPLIGGI
eukprot:828001-Prymnesium_polylepis.1